MPIPTTPDPPDDPTAAAALRLSGRILFLSRDPALIERQLRGRDSTLTDAAPLRDEVSTDEITPVPCMVNWDDTLGRHPYTGLKAGDRLPVGIDGIRHAGIDVVVAGARFGKGSSREHSPRAEQLAGVRLVIAESFERLYRQNADNIGLFTTTDFGLLDLIRSGEPLSIEQLLTGRDALASAILRSGGLLRFGQRHLLLQANREDHRSTAMPAHGGHSSAAAPAAGAGPLTLFQKIVARRLLRTPVTEATLKTGQGVFVRADWRFAIEYYTPMAAHMLEQVYGDRLAIVDPERVIMFEDHTSYADESPVHVGLKLVSQVQRMCEAQRRFAARHGLRLHRTLSEAEAARDDGRHVAGISHAMMTERYALPGQLVVGTDSHTPHSGALGCVAFGVGTTDMANALATGAVRLTIPASLKVVLEGRPPAGVTAKDILLHLLALPSIRGGAGVGKVFEFAGEAVSAMSIDERATLTNMVAELGGLTGIVAPDAQTVRFLRERRGIEFVIEPWMQSDEGAHYADTLRVDCAQIEPMLAAPGDPGNGLSISQLTSTVPIDIAYGGSCTAGKREDFDRYHEVLEWAAQRGLRTAPGVSLYLQFGTTAVRDYCIERGYLKAFETVGARLLQPSCGACANCGPGSSSRPEQVTVSAINRNFPGRSGPGQVWLASPPTVAASAIAGQLCSFETLRQTHGS